MLKAKSGVFALGLWVSMSLMAASTAVAAESCATLKSENKRLQQENEKLKAALSQVSGYPVPAPVTLPNLAEIVRHPDGKVRRMFQIKADLHCMDQGMRLPTARELALISQSMGAKGISETPKEGYYLVRGSDPSGRADDFYFNNEGYQRPAGPRSGIALHGENWFWSSAVHPDYPHYAYFLDGDDGAIYHAFRSRSAYGAVICLPGSR